MVGTLAAIWGANFPISQFLLDSMDVLTLRFTASFLSLCIYCALFFPYIKRLNKITAGNFLSILLLSIPTIFTVPLLNLYALTFLDSASALFLIYTMPAMTSILLIICSRQKVKVEFAPIILSVLGVLFVIGLPVKIGFGEIIILLSALMWAIGGLLNQRYMPSVPLTEVSFIQLSFVSLCNIIIFTIFSDQDWAAITTLSLANLAALLYVGVIAGGLAFYIWFELIKAHGASSASYCTLWSPILGILFILIITTDAVNLNVIVGGSLIVMSIYIKNFYEKRVRIKQDVIHDQNSAAKS